MHSTWYARLKYIMTITVSKLIPSLILAHLLSSSVPTSYAQTKYLPSSVNLEHVEWLMAQSFR